MMKRRSVSAALTALTVCIVASRVVLCVHTPLDVIAGIAVGAAAAVAAWKATDISYASRRGHITVTLCYASVFGTLFAVSLAAFGADPADLATQMGFFCGFLLSRHLEHEYVGFEPIKMQATGQIRIYSLGILAAAAVLIAPTVLIPVYGAAAGGFLMMVWAFLLYPKALRDGRLDRLAGTGPE
jgi:hypothetical protein